MSGRGVAGARNEPADPTRQRRERASYEAFQRDPRVREFLGSADHYLDGAPQQTRYFRVTDGSTRRPSIPDIATTIGALALRPAG